MKEIIKHVLILLGLMLMISVSCMGQYDSFSSYVKYLEDTSKTKQKPLHSFVMEWYGVKYKLGGSTKRGIDCSQFTKKLYSEVYGKKLGDNCFEQWRQTKRIKKDELEIGDLIFFRSRQSPSGWHCGIYLGRDTFVHSANKKEGVKISSLFEPRYLRSYKGAGRI
jgi:lipoprotein Spr